MVSEVNRSIQGDYQDNNDGETTFLETGWRPLCIGTAPKLVAALEFDVSHISFQALEEVFDCEEGYVSPPRVIPGR